MTMIKMLEESAEQPERYYEWMLWKSRQEDAKMKTLKKTSSMIWVTFRKEGLHKYPAALDDPKSYRWCR